MKKQKQKENTEKQGCLGALFELVGELLIMLVFVAVGFPIYLLLPDDMTENWDVEIVAFLGILIIFAISVIVYLIIRAIKKGRVKKRFPLKNKASEGEHCNYGSIYELYEDLKDTVTDIAFEVDTIILYCKSVKLTIEKRYTGAGYYTVMGGIRHDSEVLDKDIYWYALEFAHDGIKNGGEITVSDDRITAIKPHGIVYTDIFDREFVIDFADCADEYAKEGVSAFGCIGECDAKQLTYTFHTPRVKTKIVFDSVLVTDKKIHPLRGSRKKRFSELKKKISENRYSVCDKDTYSK